MKVVKAEEPDGGGRNRSGGSLAAGRCSWFIDDEEIYMRSHRGEIDETWWK